MIKNLYVRANYSKIINSGVFLLLNRNLIMKPSYFCKIFLLEKNLISGNISNFKKILNFFKENRFTFQENKN